jgi:hypothetical protein
MSVPMRMNLVDVEYTPLLSGAQQTMDSDFNEPRTGARRQYGAAVSAKSQVVWGQRHRRDASVTGDPANATGHLCLSVKAMTAGGWVFSKGDLITKIAGVAQNLEVIEVRPVGHLNGKSNLTLVFFGNNEDTNPNVRG